MKVILTGGLKHNGCVICVAVRVKIVSGLTVCIGGLIVLLSMIIAEIKEVLIMFSNDVQKCKQSIHISIII